MIQQNQNKPDEQKQMGSPLHKAFLQCSENCFDFCALFLSLHLLRQFLSPQIDLQLILHTASSPHYMDGRLVLLMRHRNLYHGWIFGFCLHHLSPIHFCMVILNMC